MLDAEKATAAKRAEGGSVVLDFDFFLLVIHIEREIFACGHFFLAGRNKTGRLLTISLYLPSVSLVQWYKDHYRA